MLRFYADEFCRATCLIGQLHSLLTAARLNPTNDSWGDIANVLGKLERDGERLGLVSTLAQVRRLKPLFTEGTLTAFQYDKLARDVAEVEIRLNDELEARLFYMIKPECGDFMLAFGPDSDPLNLLPVEAVWGPVFVAFPSAKFDAVEALRCRGLERGTACVFHLMRVLEIGLTAMGAVFGVSLAHTNWGPAIENIESRVRSMHTDPTWKSHPDRKDKQEFYSQAASHFAILKDAWRNYTAHARGKYTESEASDVLIGVRAFMSKLTAGGLHE